MESLLLNEHFLNGLLQLAGLFLAVAAGIFALSLFKISHQVKELWSWKILIIALIFFAIHKIFSALHAFDILRTAYLGQLLPFVIQALVLWAVSFQIQTVKVMDNKKKR